MKSIFRFILLALVVLGSTAALSKASDPDAYQVCISRMTNYRLNC